MAARRGRARNLTSGLFIGGVNILLSNFGFKVWIYSNLNIGIVWQMAYWGVDLHNNLVCCGWVAILSMQLANVCSLLVYGVRRKEVSIEIRTFPVIGIIHFHIKYNSTPSNGAGASHFLSRTYWTKTMRFPVSLIRFIFFFFFAKPVWTVTFQSSPSFCTWLWQTLIHKVTASGFEGELNERISPKSWLSLSPFFNLSVGNSW